MKNISGTIDCLLKKQIFWAVTFSFLTLSMGWASQSNPTGIQLEPFTLTSLEDFQIQKQAGRDSVSYDLPHFNGCEYLYPPGAPMVPSQILRFALPQGYDVESLDALVVHTTELDGSYYLYPVQKPYPTSKPKASVFTAPDPSFYEQDRFYPEKTAEWIGQGSLSGYAIAEVVVHPLKWNPVKGTLTFSQIQISLNLVPSSEGPKVQRRTARGEEIFRQSVKNLVVNPDQVPDQAAMEVIGTSSGRDDLVEYLIITKAENLSYFQKLADWKTKKGVPAEAVTTTWVYANYGTGSDDDQTKIRECIKDYWQTKGLIYVLLGGDTHSSAPPVPDRRAFVMSKDNGDKIPCDLYFQDLDGTWDDDGDKVYGEYPEDNIDMYSDVYVGRASVSNTTEASRFVNKVLQYEGESSQPPLSTDYQLKMLFLASQLGGGINGKALKEKIDEDTPARFDPITKLYQSDGNLSPYSAMTEMNKGYNFINHSGHGSNTSLQAGASYLNNTQMANLTNSPEFSIFYSHSCYSCNFAYTDCIGEKFLNSTNGGGFYVGNSRYGWGSNPIYSSLSGRLDRDFFKAIFLPEFYYYPLGQIHAEAKHQRVPTSKLHEYERYCQYELVLLGDPEMPVWKDTPQELVVSHSSTLPLGQSTFDVKVTSGGMWVQDARVCLWKGDEVYLVGETDAFGDVSFNPSPTTEGTLYVTATKEDHLPKESSALVGLEPLATDTDTISEATGGTVNFTLDAGSPNAGRSFIILGSVSGTSPGTPLPGGHVILPLNWDFFTDFVFSLINTSMFSNFMATLDGSGQASAQLNSPPVPGASGLIMYYAYGLSNPWDYVSNPVEITFGP